MFDINDCKPKKNILINEPKVYLPIIPDYKPFLPKISEIQKLRDDYWRERARADTNHPSDRYWAEVRANRILGEIYKLKEEL
jgi:hypothetical protein